MKRASPESAGVSRGAELPAIGRASRFECKGGAELWPLPAADRGVVERLLRLGNRGVGGVMLAGWDDEGVWLVRSAADPTLSRWIKEQGRVPWRTAVQVAASLASALDACEAESLFPGALVPTAVSIRTATLTAELRAEPLVRTLVGAGAIGDPKTPGESASPRWIAPEQAAGAPWDNAANRYVLGLILYRMLSGEHAFGGKGLRLGLEKQAHHAGT